MGKGVVDVACLYINLCCFCISLHFAAERRGTLDASHSCHTASHIAQSFQRSPPFHISIAAITQNYYQCEKKFKLLLKNKMEE